MNCEMCMEKIRKAQGDDSQQTKRIKYRPLIKDIGFHYAIKMFATVFSILNDPSVYLYVFFRASTSVC